ncbi:MAG: 16S rRNA (guanine(527)-N(7))-methyltransferase RsmG [Syntrophales bacterium]
MQDNFTDILSRAASGLGIRLGEREISLFRMYERELLLWNNRINLIRLKTPVDLPVKHCVDSLIPLKFIAARSASLLDIGSGAGFPGIPLKIAADSLAVTLMEASRKKASFLKYVVSTLGLTRIDVLQSRAESLAGRENYKGAYEIVVSRAAFKLSEFVALATPFLSPSGIVIAMKGRGIQQELEAALPELHALGLKVRERAELRLPVTGDTRNIIIITRY